MSIFDVDKAFQVWVTDEVKGGRGEWGDVTPVIQADCSFLQLLSICRASFRMITHFQFVWLFFSQYQSLVNRPLFDNLQSEKSEELQMKRQIFCWTLKAERQVREKCCCRATDGAMPFVNTENLRIFTFAKDFTNVESFRNRIQSKLIY